MDRDIVSRFGNDAYAGHTLLVAETTVTRTPILGTVLYDDTSQFRPIRTYRRMALNFPPILARHIANPILTDEHIIHDARRLYVDSSIHVAAAAGRNADAIAAAQLRILAERPQPPRDDYAAESALVLHNEGGGTWGHFLVQNFPKALLYLKHFPHGRIVVPRAHMDRLNNNFARVFALFGIPPARLIPVDHGQSYRFRELTLIDFLFDFPSQAVHPLVLDLLGGSGPVPPPRGRLYVERIGGAGTRAIVNHAELAPVLARHGLTTRVLGLAPVQHQAALWRNSAMVVATLGSDLANIVFGQPGTRLLVLSPDWFGDAFFYQLAVAKRMQWNELRCGTRAEPAAVEHQSSFRVDPALLDTMLDTLAPA